MLRGIKREQACLLDREAPRAADRKRCHLCATVGSGYSLLYGNLATHSNLSLEDLSCFANTG